ncbi:NAD(P)-dependent alcohol dehydrogenase [Terriglobus roseus]|uniref:Uncharacterized zinc-type alcohol dehydrogenase-like protein n=1 Tax=Terriglobus roseus TaxID=392734 RepID=A0A1H4K551_9BACT|nr:NAD(P)-dependent alcohol dehydrogenase [Terriglobus roseus]SEB53699.1 uncharacterized zinc-type alcohol dehydrogenase-like protein [Terriglobus roseus]
MIPSIGYATNHSFLGLKPYKFERPDARPNEVTIEVLYCGVCHSDIHQVKNEWGNTVYPCVPGHEVVGRVTAVGDSVTTHQIGDLVGVGCMIDSCRECEPCRSGDENYCEGPNSWLATYNGPMVPAKKAADEQNHYGRENTFGGYSNVVVVPEDFVLKIPASLDPKAAAPLLCAGVTTYSPMKHWGVKAGSKVGIVGFGGLGHIAAKIAVAMGATVVLFTTTEEKQDEAIRLGATAVMEKDLKEEVDPTNPLTRTFDFILSTVPEKHNLNPYLPLLKRDATMAICGDLGPLEPINNMQTASHRNSVAGSLIGSIAETQEVLDFCAEHNVAPDIQMIAIADINDAYKEVEKGDVRFRYVIDMSTLKDEEA